MQYNEFIKAVQGYTGIDDKYEAEDVIKATLETLSERLTDNEAKHIISQLPAELKSYLTVNKTESFSVDEFYRRVSSREGKDENTARKHSRAVLQVLNEAITKGEMSHIKAQLPEEFMEIFP